MLDPTDDIIDAAREQRAELLFSTDAGESDNFYFEPDGDYDAEPEVDFWSHWRREDFLELVDAPAPVDSLSRSLGTPVRRAFGRVPRRSSSATKRVGAADDDDSEPEVGRPNSVSPQVTGEVPHVG